MKSEQRLRDLTLRLIQILVWFEIMWAVVFLVGTVFQWSGLTDQLSTAFFGSGICALFVLAALTLLNVTANLNIISKAQARQVAEVEVVESKPGSFARTLCTSSALIGLVLLCLWFVEWRLYRARVSETESQLVSLSSTALLEEAFALVQRDGPASELADVREALAASIQAGDRLSVIIPRQVKGATTYSEFAAWWGNRGDRISQARGREFVPRDSERAKWEMMVAGRIDQFTAPNGDDLRAFRKVTRDGQQIILMIDTGRRSDYSKGSL